MPPRLRLPIVSGPARTTTSERTPTNWPTYLRVVVNAVPSSRLDALYAAGLSRCNVSIHGFSEGAFVARTGATARAWSQRNAFLEAAIAHGRALKTHYVYTGPADEPDLAAFLSFAARRGLLVNVLNDLSREDLDAGLLESVVVGLRGAPVRRWIEADPDSLPTTRMAFADGLVVELKHARLGSEIPWTTCASCTVRGRCREGIHALRVSHTDVLRPCMDRPDLGLSMIPAEGAVSPATTRASIEAFIREMAR